MSVSAGTRIPSNPWLTVRMVLVAVLTPLAAIALLAAVVIVLPSRFLAGLAIALGFGTVVRLVVHLNRKPPPGTALTEHDDPELFAIVDRLCVLADITRPELVLSNQRQPNSWVVHLPHQTPRLYLTSGLRDLLTLNELQAVLGHELTHIANHDALVMSVVGMPGSVMLRASGGGVDGLLVVAIGMLSQIGTAILSRYRELAADAGAAAITARPSALASALLKVSDSLEQLPAKDLRAATALNAFNLVAVPRRPRRGRPRSRLLGRLAATHPPLQSRLDALFALERVQQSRRGWSPRP
jgi:heat shock protein HtpX